MSVLSPEGIETELVERSKVRYLDHDTFWAVLSDVWKRHRSYQWYVIDTAEGVLIGLRGST